MGEYQHDEPTRPRAPLSSHAADGATSGKVTPAQDQGRADLVSPRASGIAPAFSPSTLMMLQRTAGNAAVNHLLRQFDARSGGQSSAATVLPLQRRQAVGALATGNTGGRFDVVAAPVRPDLSAAQGAAAPLQRMNVSYAPGQKTPRSFDLLGHENGRTIPLATFAVYPMTGRAFIMTFKTSMAAIVQLTGVAQEPATVASFAEPTANAKHRGYGAACAYFAAVWTAQQGYPLIVVGGAVESAFPYYVGVGFQQIPGSDPPSFVATPEAVIAAAGAIMARHDLQPA